MSRMMMMIRMWMIRYSVEPSPGTHIIYWGGTWIKLDRVREQQQVSSHTMGFI